jgi:adenylate cyclase
MSLAAGNIRSRPAQRRVIARLATRHLKDVFALQDGITGKIVAALTPKLITADQSRPARQETSNVEAYDLVLRGAALHGHYTRESQAMAREMFEKAIALDPKYASPYVWLAWSHFNDWEFPWTTGSPDALDRSLEAAKTAVALDDSLSGAHVVLGWDLAWKKRQHDIAIAELERAVSLDPNSATGYASLAEVLNFAGRPEESIRFSKHAMRLDPYYGPWVVFHLAESYFQLRRYDDDIAAIQDALRRNPNFSPARRVLAVIYTELGQDKKAQAEVAEILRISPGASLDLWRERLPFKNQADLDRYILGLRKAGLV